MAEPTGSNRPFPEWTGKPEDLEEAQALWPIFVKFDTDGSDAIDSTELNAMIESLGMAVSAANLNKWIVEADDSKDGLIQFDEFVGIMQKAANTQSNALSLKAIIKRSKGTKPPMAWRSDKKGPGISLKKSADTKPTEDCVTRSSAEGWAAQLVDAWFTHGRADDKMDRASVLLEIVELGGPLLVGVVGRNYNPSDWNDELCKSNHAAVWESTAGNFTNKKAPDTKGASQLKKMDVGQRIQLELEMISRSLEIRVLSLETTAAGKEWVEKASVKLPEGTTAAEVAVAVCIGPSTGGPTTIRLVGGSSEKQSNETMATTENYGSGGKAAEDPLVAEALKMAM